MRVYLFDGQGRQISRTAEPGFQDPAPTSAEIAEAREGGVIATNPRPDYITALVQLRMLQDAYLMVLRVVDPQLLSYYTRNREAVVEYNRLDRDRQAVQYAFFVIYALVALLVLLAAI